VTETRYDASANTRVDASGNTRVTNTGSHFSDSMLELLDATVGEGYRAAGDELVWVLKVSPMDLSTRSATDLYFASTTFRTDGSDTPANTTMLGRLVPPNVRVSLVSGGTISNGISQTRGAIKVLNPGDEGFDRNGTKVEGRGWFDEYRTKYSFVGRDAELYIGPVDGTFAADFEKYDQFNINDVEWTMDSLVFTPGPALTDWRKFVQQNTYGQGYEIVDGETVTLPDGTVEIITTTFDNLSGVYKPLAFGRCYGIEPQVISKNSEIYQYHAGGEEVEDLEAVYEDGLTFTEITDYTHDTDDGTIDLVTETSAIITADIKGAKAGPSSSYVDLPGDIVQAVLREHVGIAQADIKSETFGDLDIAYPYESGYYFGSQAVTRADFMTSMLAPLGFWYTARGGRLAAGWLKNPSAETAALTINESDVRSVRRLSTTAPIWRVKVGYAPIGRPISYNDFAGAVTEAEMARQSQDYRYAQAIDEGVLELHKPDEMTVNSRFTSESDAQNLADTMLRLFSRPRDIIEVSLQHKFLRYDLGEVIRVGIPRYNFIDDGYLMTEDGDKFILEESGADTLVTDGGDTIETDAGDALVTGATGSVDEYLLKQEDENGTNFLVVGYVDNPANDEFKLTLWG
jgi:hypothetical protein